MQDYYDEWNSIKKKLNSKSRKVPSFSEMEVWWLSVGQNVGSEVYGKGSLFLRPVLVVTKFSHKLFLGVPMSSGVNKIDINVKVIFKRKAVSVIVSQTRTFSSKRISNKRGELNSNDFKRVRKAIKLLI